MVAHKRNHSEAFQCVSCSANPLRQEFHRLPIRHVEGQVLQAAELKEQLRVILPSRSASNLQPLQLRAKAEQCLKNAVRQAAMSCPDAMPEIRAAFQGSYDVREQYRELVRICIGHQCLWPFTKLYVDARYYRVKLAKAHRQESTHLFCERIELNVELLRGSGRFGRPCGS